MLLGVLWWCRPDQVRESQVRSGMGQRLSDLLLSCHVVHFSFSHKFNNGIAVNYFLLALALKETNWRMTLKMKVKQMCH